MHFGKIVKNVAHSKNLTAEDVAVLLDCSLSQVLTLYDTRDWTSGNIKDASEALEHDFGNYLNTSKKFDFMINSDTEEYKEFHISIKYPKGKEFLLKSWLDKMMMIARSIGLETGK